MIRDYLHAQLVLLLLLLVLIFGGLLITHLHRRHGRMIRERYSRKLFDCLEPQERLPDVRFPDIRYAFHRQTLLSLIGELYVMLEGIEARILQLIFRTNGLYHHILRECRQGNDARKVRAISVYLNLPIRPAMMVEVSRYLDSENPELRMISLLVWLNMDPGTMTEKLIGYPHRLSPRDCAHIFDLFVRRCVPGNETARLLSSPNPSVVRLGKYLLKQRT